MARIQGLDKVVHDQDHILILGSIASVESLKQGIHYAHPSNRFWKVLSAIYDCPTTTVDQKKAVLEKAGIALWDSCATCIRKGSSDSSIKEVVPNDIPGFLKEHPGIEKILCNGKTSYQTMRKYYPELLDKIEVLPSTSAANAQVSLEELIEKYRKSLGVDDGKDLLGKS